MKRQLLQRTVLLALLLAVVAGGGASAQEARQSTTGPTPPPGVVSPPLSDSKAAVTLAGVPPYLWRHGCGPTAVGMVVGYWDARGFDDLIPGSADTQTAAVTQAIASGGSASTPYPAGSEQHYEDCASPEDTPPNLQQDSVLQQARTPHADNCLADFMRTSRSTAGNYYGWSWSNDIISSFNGYVSLRSPYYVPAARMYYFASTLTFGVVKQEIDAGRPMVFLVDSDGDGNTDHFVAIVGYNDGPPQTYLYYDTWDLQTHEAEFRGMTAGNPWGVWAGWSFGLTGTFAFLSEPDGGTFQEGNSLNWTVLLEGAVGTPTYRWLKNSSPLQDKTDSTFSIDSLTLDDAGWYTCEVTDGNGTVMTTDAVYVKVNKLNAIPATGPPAIMALAALCFLLGVKGIHARRREPMDN
jgi:hypothetical protein